MRKLETYHYNFESAGTHTFELKANPIYSILVKNLTTDKILMSYGTEIDTTNDSYSEILKNTAELFGYESSDDETTVKVTVQAAGTGLVELRVVNN